MAFFLLDTWVVLKGKEEENEEVVRQILQYGRHHPDIFKHVKSLRCFKQSIGGKPPGMYVLITEFASLSDMEDFLRKIKVGGEWKQIEQKWKEVMDQSSIESIIWSDMFRELWTEK
ncbi:MAG: hypothetical protein QHH12_01415 [Candidatus Bathyarchaeota archaeon]|nr:hypothetical protein [Candidatus Bathyarchaeota archaeon A05DMB-3]MDH7606414.1 hypothetical protein [Candidatus Bathyarchaeota archaeon]